MTPDTTFPILTAIHPPEEEVGDDRGDNNHNDGVAKNHTGIFNFNSISSRFTDSSNSGLMVEKSEGELCWSSQSFMSKATSKQAVAGKFEPKDNQISITEKRRLMTLMETGHKRLLRGFSCLNFASHLGSNPHLKPLSKRLLADIAKILREERSELKKPTRHRRRGNDESGGKSESGGVGGDCGESGVNEEFCKRRFGERKRNVGGRESDDSDCSLRPYHDPKIVASDLAEKKKFMANQDDLHQRLRRKNLGNYLHCFLSQLEMNPQELQIVERRGKCLSISAITFLDTYQNLKDGFLKRLKMSVKEEFDIDEYRRKVSKKWVSKQNHLKEMEKISKEQRASFERDQKSLDDKINALMEELNHLSNSHQKKMVSLKAEAENEKDILLDKHQGVKHKLEIRRLNAKETLADIQRCHFKKEQDLRKQSFKLETTVENWKEKYDSDLSKLQDEYDEITTEYEPIQRQLHELEENFKKVEEIVNDIKEVRKEEERIRKAATEELKEMNQSATVFQAFWRARSTLRELEKRNARKK